MQTLRLQFAKPWVLVFSAGVCILVSSTILKFEVISFVVLFALLYVGIFAFSPKNALLLLLLSRPLVDLFWNTPLFGLKNPLYLISGITIVLLMLTLYRQRFNPLQVPYSKFAISFLSIETISFLLVSVDDLTGPLDHFLRVLSGFLMFFSMPAIFTTKEDIRRLLFAVLLSTILPLMLTFYTWAQGDAGIFSDYFQGGNVDTSAVMMEFRDLRRLSGLWQGTFNVAFYCVIVIFLGQVMLPYVKNVFLRNLLRLYVFLSLPPLFQTFLRAGWAMAISGSAIWFIFKRKRIHLILLFLGVFLIFVFSDSAQHRFADELAWLQGQGTFERIGSGRGNQWTKYWDIYWDQYSVTDKLFGRLGVVGRPENQMVYLLINGGFLGLLTYVLFTVAITKGLWQAFRYSRDSFLSDFALLAFIFHVAFVFAWIGGTPLLWINAQLVYCSLTGIALRMNSDVLSKRRHVQ